MHYSRKKERNIIKKAILCRQNYSDIGEVSHLQVFCPDNYSRCYYNHYMEQLANTQTFQKRRQKSYFPSVATYVRNWDRDCEICIQNKRINDTRFTPELIHIPDWDLIPEDIMPIDLLTELPPSGVTRISLQQLMFFRDMDLPIQFQLHGSKHMQNHYRHYDKTRLFTYAHHDRQRECFCLPSYT